MPNCGYLRNRWMPSGDTGTVRKPRSSRPWIQKSERDMCKTWGRQENENIKLTCRAWTRTAKYPEWCRHVSDKGISAYTPQNHDLKPWTCKVERLAFARVWENIGHCVCNCTHSRRTLWQVDLSSSHLKFSLSLTVQTHTWPPPPQSTTIRIHHQLPIPSTTISIHHHCLHLHTNMSTHNTSTIQPSALSKFFSSSFSFSFLLICICTQHIH